MEEEVRRPLRPGSPTTSRTLDYLRSQRDHPQGATRVIGGLCVSSGYCGGAHCRGTSSPTTPTQRTEGANRSAGCLPEAIPHTVHILRFYLSLSISNRGSLVQQPGGSGPRSPPPIIIQSLCGNVTSPGTQITPTYGLSECHVPSPCKRVGVGVLQPLCTP